MNKFITLLALALTLSACAGQVAYPTPEPNCHIAAEPAEYCGASLTYHRAASVTYQCAEGTAADLDGQNITGLANEAYDCFSGDPNDRTWCCAKVER